MEISKKYSMLEMLVYVELNAHMMHVFFKLEGAQLCYNHISVTNILPKKLFLKQEVNKEIKRLTNWSPAEFSKCSMGLFDYITLNDRFVQWI